MSGTRHALVAVAFAAALILAGCGGSSSGSTPATSVASVPPATTTTSAPVQPPPPHRPKPKPAKPTTTATTTTTATAPPPPPATTPPAPDGLTAAAGYGSYDDCQGACSGAVPGALRRPLHLPSPGAGCPASPGRSLAGTTVLGSGPAGPAQAPTLPVTSFIGSAWLGARVTWIAAPSYTGAVLIRGRELGGLHAVGFGSGHVPIDELQLLNGVSSSAGAREWPSFTRVRGPGCYAYQIDGTSFSTVVVFKAG